MRITNGMMAQNTINNINSNLSRLSKIQNQSSSLKRIQVPSDDPVAAARSLKMKSYLTAIEQQQKNADDASSWMKFSDSALSQVKGIFDQIRELTVGAANGTLTDDERNKIEIEIEELKKGIIEIANSSYSGRYVFSGYNTDEAPFKIVSTNVGDMVLYKGKYMSLGGVISSSVSNSDLMDFFMNNMDKISGQPELKSAKFEGFTAVSPSLDFTVTLNGVSSTISLSDGVTYDIDTLVKELQSKINTAFPSGSGQPDPLIKVSKEDGKVVLTVQDGRSISIDSGTMDVRKLGFSNGMKSTDSDNEKILYKMGKSNQVAINTEGKDIFGEGSDSFFNTLKKIELALKGETQYKTATYHEGPPADVTVETHDLDLSSLLADLDKDIDRLLTARSDLGARANYVDLTQNRLGDNYTTYSELLSKNDDIDLAEISMKMADAQAVYMAALAASAKGIQSTLLDFLR
jgi:flagellar hook-associated protein 3 FlgL